MTRKFLADEMVSRRTYAIPFTACMILDDLTVCMRRKDRIVAVSIYNLAFDLAVIQEREQCTMMSAMRYLVEKIDTCPVDSRPISSMGGRGTFPERERVIRRSYGFSLITRHIIDSLSVWTKMKKGRILELAIRNLVYDMAELRRGRDIALTDAMESIEERLRSRPLDSYVMLNACVIDDFMSVMDTFIFEVKDE